MVRFASTRPWHKDSHLLGMAGEIALADFYGAILDTRLNRLGGDKGVDLEVFSIITGKFEWIKHDVKAAQGPKELLVGVDSPHPPRLDCIYVLARYLGGPTGFDAELLAWEWGHEMVKCPKEFWSKNNKEVYHKPRHLLRPLSDLKEYYHKRWRWFEEQSAPPRGYPAEYPMVRPEIKNNPFHGWCAKCGGSGLYHAAGEWLCNTHRVW